MNATGSARSSIGNAGIAMLFRCNGSGVEHDLLAKAQELTSLEVSNVVVPPNAPARSDGAEQAAHAGSNNGS